MGRSLLEACVFHNTTTFESKKSRPLAFRLVLKLFFYNVFQRPVLVLKILELFNIRCFHTAVSGLSVVVGSFRNIDLPAGSFGFNRLNHSDDLMLSETGYTQSDLLR